MKEEKNDNICQKKSKMANINPTSLVIKCQHIEHANWMTNIARINLTFKFSQLYTRYNRQMFDLNLNLNTNIG